MGSPLPAKARGTPSPSGHMAASRTPPQTLLAPVLLILHLRLLETGLTQSTCNSTACSLPAHSWRPWFLPPHPGLEMRCCHRPGIAASHGGYLCPGSIHSSHPSSLIKHWYSVLPGELRLTHCSDFCLYFSLFIPNPTPHPFSHGG